jgi:hypothetical protein
VCGFRSSSSSFYIAHLLSGSGLCLNGQIPSLNSLTSNSLSLSLFYFNFKPHITKTNHRHTHTQTTPRQSGLVITSPAEFLFLFFIFGPEEEEESPDDVCVCRWSFDWCVQYKKGRLGLEEEESEEEEGSFWKRLEKYLPQPLLMTESEKRDGGSLSLSYNTKLK